MSRARRGISGLWLWRRRRTLGMCGWALLKKYSQGSPGIFGKGNVAESRGERRQIRDRGGGGCFSQLGRCQRWRCEVCEPTCRINWASHRSGSRKCWWSRHSKHMAVDLRHCQSRRPLYETRNSAEDVGKGVMKHCPGVPFQSNGAKLRLRRAKSSRLPVGGWLGFTSGIASYR